MRWIRKADNIVRATNPWAAWIWRLSPILATGAASAWMTHLLKAPGWAVYLGALGAANIIFMLIFWVGVARLYSKHAELNSAEVVADKQRKREQIRKWRAMLAGITGIAVNNNRHFREFLAKHEDFLSLKPHLDKDVLQYLSCEYDRADVIYMIEPFSNEVSKLAKEWGVD